MSLLIAIITIAIFKSATAETNTVSSTVVTNNTPPTANSPSVVVNNSDVCKTAVAGAVQTQILGISSGITVTDENCERIKLSRSLYSMGMKVAAVSTLCADPRVWDAMYMAGTYCPYMGAIGEEAKDGWKANPELVPDGSVVMTKIETDIKEQKKILDSLGFFVNEKNSKFEIKSPTFRPDIVGEADIVEEIIRIYGYNKIPLKKVTNHEEKKQILNTKTKTFYKSKKTIALNGYSEVVTWSFMDEKKAKIISDEIISLKNPISTDLNTMRPSTLPNLLEAINQNKSRMYLRAKIFEVGPNFSKSLPDQQENVATAIAYGSSDEQNWLSNKKNIDVFSIKADLFSILANLNVPIDNLLYEKLEGQIYHPGKSSSLKLGKNKIANFGELHPILLKTMDVNFKVYGFEIYLENISQFQENKSFSKGGFTYSLNL